METSFKQNLFYFCPALFCFCLPFGSMVLSAIIVLWVLVSFFNISRKQLKQGFMNKRLQLFYAFFLLTVISALFSSNLREAGFSIEVKLSFFFLPYLFFCFKWPPDILKRCAVSFVSGCFFACLYLIGRACVYAAKGNPEYFFYTLFSDFIHASYFAMYLVFAITIIAVFYSDWFRERRNELYSSYVFLLVFAVTIFLCSSKLGLISFFLAVPLLIAYRFRAALSLKRIAVCLILLAVLGGILSKVFPEPFSRFKSLGSVSLESIDKTSSESTGVRILIWNESLTIISQHFWFGTGVGDANDKLQEAYAQDGLTGAYEHHFNAHNQFFQTFIGLGLAGFILLLLLTFGALFRALREKQFVVFMFCLLIIMNFMVESMLQTSAGVLFFAFFSCFLEKAGEAGLLAPATEKVPAEVSHI